MSEIATVYIICVQSIADDHAGRDLSPAHRDIPVAGGEASDNAVGERPAGARAMRSRRPFSLAIDPTQ